ncbi:MAG: hypothetical protein IJ306_04680 [Oscillospiraceae bacterium]|nr:hypothetical protein [Oscillospiraceae bacterium]
MNGLKGIYEEDFNEIKKYIEKEAAAGTARDDALESLLAIYVEAQENGAELSDIRGESAKDYAKEVAESLPKKKRVNKILLGGILGIAAAAVLAVAGYFTSDVYFMENGGYGFAMRYPEKFDFTRIVSGKDEYSGKFTVNELSTAETDPELERFGIICENYCFYGEQDGRDDTQFDMYMVSKVRDFGEEGKMILTPVAVSNGEPVWIEDWKGDRLASDIEGALGEIKAYLNGTEYTGEIIEYDISGKDFRYKIHFTAADENADCSGNINRLISGDYVTVEFEKIIRIGWNYLGAKNSFENGMFPIFVPYSVEEEKEEIEYIKYYEETSDGAVQVVFRTYYNKELEGQSISLQPIPRKLSNKVDYAETSDPYIDDDGLICVDTEVYFKDGTNYSETLKYERKTELVYDSYPEYVEDKNFTVYVYAKRGADGKFVSVDGFGFKTWGKISVATNYNTAEYEITENGDVIVEVEYYESDDYYAPLLKETVTIKHNKY